MPWAAENNGLLSPVSASSDSYCSLDLPRPDSAGLCVLRCLILQLAPLKNGPSGLHWLVALPWPREVNSHSLGLGLEGSISHQAAGPTPDCSGLAVFLHICKFAAETWSSPLLTHTPMQTCSSLPGSADPVQSFDTCLPQTLAFLRAE